MINKIDQAFQSIEYGAKIRKYTETMPLFAECQKNWVKYLSYQGNERINQLIQYEVKVILLANEEALNFKKNQKVNQHVSIDMIRTAIYYCEKITYAYKDIKSELEKNTLILENEQDLILEKDRFSYKLNDLRVFLYTFSHLNFDFSPKMPMDIPYGKKNVLAPRNYFNLGMHMVVQVNKNKKLDSYLRKFKPSKEPLYDYIQDEYEKIFMICGLFKKAVNNSVYRFNSKKKFTTEYSDIIEVDPITVILKKANKVIKDINKINENKNNKITSGQLDFLNNTLLLSLNNEITKIDKKVNDLINNLDVINQSYKFIDDHISFRQQLNLKLLEKLNNKEYFRYSTDDLKLSLINEMLSVSKVNLGNQNEIQIIEIKPNNHTNAYEQFLNQMTTEITLEELDYFSNIYTQEDEHQFSTQINMINCLYKELFAKSLNRVEILNNFNDFKELKLPTPIKCLLMIDMLKCMPKTQSLCNSIKDQIIYHIHKVIQTHKVIQKNNNLMEIENGPSSNIENGPSSNSEAFLGNLKRSLTPKLKESSYKMDLEKVQMKNLYELELFYTEQEINSKFKEFYKKIDIYRMSNAHLEPAFKNILVRKLSNIFTYAHILEVVYKDNSKNPFVIQTFENFYGKIASLLDNKEEAKVSPMFF